MAGSKITLDSRDRKRYEYTRWCYQEEKNQWTILEISGGEFGNVFVPDSYMQFFRKVFSNGSGNGSGGTNRVVPGRPGSDYASQQQSFHLLRKHEKAYTISITRTWQEPISFKPLRIAENAKRRTQFILLDADSMVAFMESLSTYVEDIIPAMKVESKGQEDVDQMSEFSSFTTTSQVRGTCTLKKFEKTNAVLNLALDQMTPSSFGLDLRYSVDSVPGTGMYINEMVLGWFLAERPKILHSALKLRSGGYWESMEPTAVAAKKRKLLSDDDMFLPPWDEVAEDKTTTTPWQSPDITTTAAVKTEAAAADDEEEEIEGGGKRRPKLLPADPDRTDDIVSSSEMPMTKEERKAFAGQLDGIIKDDVAPAAAA
jgi:hypothetical protein